MRMTKPSWTPRQWLITLVLAFSVSPALAHKGSDAYLDVQQLPAPAASSNAAGGSAQAPGDFRLTLAVALRDLDLVVPIDANADARVTWGEARAATPQVLALLNETTGLTTQPAGAGQAQADARPCMLSWQDNGMERRSDGVYFRAVAQARCPAGQALRFHYALLRNQDATHRLLVTGRMGGKDVLSTMSPRQGSLLLAEDLASASAGSGDVQAPGDRASRWSTLRDYFSLGMHHLLQGYDHLAFLLALVLPLQLSLRRRALAAGRGGAADDHRAAWLALLRTVTAFTVGHSITLMLATFGWTQASPLWVEPVIALSIAVTALLNLYPVKWIRFDVLALLFGLIHGFGFAGLLQEAAAPSGLLPWALTGFNLGVEAGQLTAVLGWVLVSQALVGKSWYPGLVVRGGSVALLLLASGWFWQRVS